MESKAVVAVLLARAFTSLYMVTLTYRNDDQGDDSYAVLASFGILMVCVCNFGWHLLQKHLVLATSPTELVSVGA